MPKFLISKLLQKYKKNFSSKSNLRAVLEENDRSVPGKLVKLLEDTRRRTRKQNNQGIYYSVLEDCSENEK